MFTRSSKTIVEWLVDGARSAPLAQDVLTELCERLSGCGLALWRAVVFVRTLHPEVVGRRFAWRPDTGTVVTEGSFELLERDAFRNSPMAYVGKTGNPLRRRLADPDCPMDFPVFRELREEGVTDYVVSPLCFTNGEIHIASWATRQPGGFTDAEIAIIDSIVAPLARVAEIRAYYRTAGNLLATYVGKNAGERVLAGRIRRGDTEKIHAAIWLSDMRGFTKLADRLPPQTWSICLIAISIARCRRSSSRAERSSNSWATGCWRYFPPAGTRMPANVRRRAGSAAHAARAQCRGVA